MKPDGMGVWRDQAGATVASGARCAVFHLSAMHDRRRRRGAAVGRDRVHGRELTRSTNSSTTVKPISLEVDYRHRGLNQTRSFVVPIRWRRWRGQCLFAVRMTGGNKFLPPNLAGLKIPLFGCFLICPDARLQPGVFIGATGGAGPLGLGADVHDAASPSGAVGGNRCSALQMRGGAGLLRLLETELGSLGLRLGSAVDQPGPDAGNRPACATRPEAQRLREVAGTNSFMHPTGRHANQGADVLDVAERDVGVGLRQRQSMARTARLGGQGGGGIDRRSDRGGIRALRCVHAGPCVVVRHATSVFEGPIRNYCRSKLPLRRQVGSSTFSMTFRRDPLLPKRTLERYRSACDAHGCGSS